ncbi:MAG: FAD-binding protein [Spirochaetaceae bacterium]|nr:FAD-binding protein [Spirochaetaceae bacterium]
MGFREILIKLPTDYDDDSLNREIEKTLNIKRFTKVIGKKSLDARKKNKIHWQLKVAVTSNELAGGERPQTSILKIPYKKRDKKAVVIGSGPAGFFAAYTLQKGGFKTILVERGKDVIQRKADIDFFERENSFTENSNYAFGEGGAGTFSDGKLTSRTKKISAEKAFILQTYIEAGAPEEIAYMTHPHLGSDNLLIMTENLRKMFIDRGGSVIFDCLVSDINVGSGKVKSLESSLGTIEGDVFLFATGHSSYETYKYLIKKGVQYRNKNFAIGSRVEHHQELINEAQWGCTSLKGVKAAEYRLTSSADNELPVYSFCMCPGGKVVPAAPYKDVNIVNGMSLYNRNSPFANAAIVAGINLESILKRPIDPLESLEWLEKLEQSFHIEDFRAPASTIEDFLRGSNSGNIQNSSYPLGLINYNLSELLPPFVSHALKRGLSDFSRKLKGFEKGNILGLESKTSALIQVHRNKDGLADRFSNLYINGEGSGYSGGIISSAADGIKGSMAIIRDF